MKLVMMKDHDDHLKVHLKCLKMKIRQLMVMSPPAGSEEQQRRVRRDSSNLLLLRLLQ